MSARRNLQLRKRRRQRAALRAKVMIQQVRMAQIQANCIWGAENRKDGVVVRAARDAARAAF